jgi:hypothetical protein
VALTHAATSPGKQLRQHSNMEDRKSTRQFTDNGSGVALIRMSCEQFENVPS